MINFFKSIFRVSDKENPRFSILKKSLSDKIDLNNIENVCFITAVEYTDSIYSELKLSIEKDEIKNFDEKYDYNTLKNAIELYLIKKKNLNNVLCILFSPYEFFENEYVLDMIEIDFELNLNDFSDSEIIYENKE